MYHDNKGKWIELPHKESMRSTQASKIQLFSRNTRQKDNKNKKLKEKSGKFKQKENGVNCKGKDGGEDEWQYTG